MKKKYIKLLWIVTGLIFIGSEPVFKWTFGGTMNIFTFIISSCIGIPIIIIGWCIK